MNYEPKRLILYCTMYSTVHMGKCLTLLNPSWRNWYCISQLKSMVAKAFATPHARTKVGES
jgi:hypothetical protein